MFHKKLHSDDSRSLFVFCKNSSSNVALINIQYHQSDFKFKTNTSSHLWFKNLTQGTWGNTVWSGTVVRKRMVLFAFGCALLCLVLVLSLDKIRDLFQSPSSSRNHSLQSPCLFESEVNPLCKNLCQDYSATVGDWK